MLSTGLVFIACVLGTLIFLAIIRPRSSGWSAIALGIVGVIYSVVAYPAYILIIVFPLSVLSLLTGCVTLVFRSRRLRGATRRNAPAANSDPTTSD